jgi:hypothetical protein
VSFFGRRYNEAASVRAIASEDADETTACDEFVYEFVRMPIGGVIFVEVATSREGPWTAWRCEGVAETPFGLALLSEPVTAEAIAHELKHGPRPN